MDTLTATSLPEQVLGAVDAALAAGTVVIQDGQLQLAAEAEPAAADALLSNPDPSNSDPTDDPSNATSGECSLEQERLILGFALHGEQDNSPIWARFRAALGLRPDQSVPDSLWSLPLHQQLSSEIEAIFQGQRDLRTLNGHTLIESTRLRLERGQIKGSLQQISADITALARDASGLIANDLQIAIELLQSTRARTLLKAAGSELELALRRDRCIEQVAQSMLNAIENARALVAGRLGQSIELECFSSERETLLEAMTQERCAAISTGIAALDMDLQGGVQPSDTGKLNVIGARTGVGKTTVGMAAAMGLALHGAGVLFLSSELSSREITARAWILEGRGRRREVASGFEAMLSQWQQERDAGVIGDFHSKALFHATAEDMIDAMHAAKARNPGLSAVFIDHFHALRPSKGYINRSQEMEARILLLYQAAKACQLDLFLMAQLNRDACLSDAPRLDHINGTDAIAQLATAVWLLEFERNSESFNPGVLQLTHAKCRNGQRAGDDFIHCKTSILQVNREYNAITSEAHC
jgi:replicative DNA helicase